MVNEDFSSAEELYKHIFPALHSKTKEFRIQKLPFVTENLIWKCLRETKWRKDIHLTLYDMVSDIFNLKEETILDYMKKRMKD